MNIINFITLGIFCYPIDLPSPGRGRGWAFPSPGRGRGWALLSHVAVTIIGVVAAALVTSRYWRLFLTAGVVAAVFRQGVVGGRRAAVLHEGDFVGQEVVDALAVDNLERRGEARHEALDELGSRILLALGSARGDEADGEVAEAEELYGVAFLQVLLHVVGVAVEDVLHVARGGTGLGGNLVCHVLGGEDAVADGLHTVHGLGVLLVEHHRAFLHFVCFWHRICPSPVWDLVFTGQHALPGRG